MLPNLQRPLRGSGRLERKKCLECSAPLTQARTMKPGRFARVKFCSLVCARANASKRFASARAARAGCEACGQPVKTASGRFCSRPCADRAARLPVRPCPVCGGPRKRAAQTCGAACGTKLKMGRLRSQRTCAICKKVFWPRRYSSGAWMKVCSMACELKRKALAHPKLTAACANCGVEFTRHQCRSRPPRTVFCTTACRIVYVRGANSTLYRGGDDPNRGRQWRLLAARIRERDGHTCQRCNKPHPGTGRAFPVDHIVPWRSFTDKAAANAPDNLVTLCASCHAIKTTVYERLWLKGDVIGFEQYRKAIRLPPLFANVEIPL